MQPLLKILQSQQPRLISREGCSGTVTWSVSNPNECFLSGYNNKMRLSQKVGRPVQRTPSESLPKAIHLIAMSPRVYRRVDKPKMTINWTFETASPFSWKLIVRSDLLCSHNIVKLPVGSFGHNSFWKICRYCFLKKPVCIFPGIPNFHYCPVLFSLVSAV